MPIDLPCGQCLLPGEISLENVERGRELLQALSQLV